jgi:hypothetical protein
MITISLLGMVKRPIFLLTSLGYKVGRIKAETKTRHIYCASSRYNQMVRASCKKNGLIKLVEFDTF